MCDPIVTPIMLGVMAASSTAGGIMQHQQAKKQQEAMDKSMKENKPPTPPAPQKQAKFQVPRSSREGGHRNVRMTGPFIPPSVQTPFGRSLGSSGAGKNLLGQ